MLALPHGGVPVAKEVAAQLKVPMDIFLVRKLGVPGHPELAMGAIAEGGIEVLDEDLIRHLGIPPAVVRQTERRSHYFHARMAEQFDFVLHFDETRAVEPLEPTALWEAGEVAETFPFGL